MSLPKEPRQLMINLMYIVLTAMLALNVSAEILNAFLTMDKGIKESTEIVSLSNNILYQSIAEQANAYPQYEKHNVTAEQVKIRINQFCNYIENLKLSVIEKTGGLDEYNLPKGKKDKDFASRFFVEGGKGNQLKDSVLNTQIGVLNLITSEEDKEFLKSKIPLNIAEIPEGSEKKDWADFVFGQMPVAAVLPLLSKYQSDAKLTETSILNFLVNKISAKPIHDEYKALIAADKNYIIKGESLKAEIFLGAYSSTTDNITVKVNGRKVPVRNGKALFESQTNSLGSQELDVEIAARNPLTGVVKKYFEKYNYEVGERSVTASADKMNVFYVGVENPLSISVAGVASQDVIVAADEVNIIKVSNNKYMVKPNRPGKAKIKVSGGGLPITTFDYRVKRIPDPLAKLGNKLSGPISPGEFKIYNGIQAHLDQFDFDAKCKIIGYELIRVDKSGDGFVNKNQGDKYNPRTRRLVDAVKRGDKYYFEKVKAKCPGDNQSRNINSLFFKIK